MTMEHLADFLEEIIAGEEFCLAEWSKNQCDYNLLHDSLKAIGRASIMPPIRNNLSVFGA